MNIALLIIDVQKAFIGERKDEPLYKKTFEYINYTASLFRQSGRPVMIIRDLSEGEGKIYENVDDLVTSSSDIEFIKYYGNGFWKTELEKILKDLGVDFVVICGSAAEYCVLSTYNGAIERGFQGAMLQNGIFAETETGLKDIAFNRPVVSYQVISYMLEQYKEPNADDNVQEM